MMWTTSEKGMGSWSTLSKKMLARCAFLPTLMYNMAMVKVGGRRWYDRIDETIIVGALPFKHHVTKVGPLVDETKT